MPTYNFKNTTSGEIIEKILRISELDKWKEENPEWETIHLSAPSLVSGSKSALSMAGKDWESHLNNIKKGAGKDTTIKS
jgi:hypothetical protein